MPSPTRIGGVKDGAAMLCGSGRRGTHRRVRDI